MSEDSSRLFWVPGPAGTLTPDLLSERTSGYGVYPNTHMSKWSGSHPIGSSLCCKLFVHLAYDIQAKIFGVILDDTICILDMNPWNLYIVDGNSCLNPWVSLTFSIKLLKMRVNSISVAALSTLLVSLVHAGDALTKRSTATVAPTCSVSFLLYLEIKRW